ncbi:endonuclease/exonuclease/phosphatase family protein [uncultured Ilyobacter sp.]|uniref:endonuclease/exonuclease/phosphatase family protein n=1 Tax=uncultured Ilyobacter sp. TaxID=544433 RepID=UPI0029C7546F|nr:endonuclease/exonuclease/phosphatase family protein [uncultured Ilyobacter sp.]
MNFFKKFFTYFLISFSIFSQEAYIASFNSLHLGWDKNKDYKSISEFLSLFDLIGLQEVMKKDGVKKLTGELERTTGEKWKYLISDHSVGTEKYREYYAYIWRDKKVKLVNKNRGFYKPNAGTNGEKEYMRDPYGADFKIGEFDFTYVLCHVVYGDSVRERRAEAYLLDKVYKYFQDLDINEQDILIGGDFNLPAYDDSFRRLFSHEDQIFYGIDPINKTTIGKSGLSNSYDNIFYSYRYTKEFTGNSGILDFTKGNYSEVRKSISDHLPVFIEVDTSEDDD